MEQGEVWSIMGAYNQFRGQHCCHNDLLLNQILKEEWAFDGVVISDWGGTHHTEQAAKFGLDLEMGTGTDGLSVNRKNAYDSYFLAKPFQEQIEAGTLDEVLLDEKVRRILRLMLRTSLRSNRPKGIMNNQAHLDIAQKIAEEGIVLLKNENQFFPLNPQTQQTIAVIGENATRRMTLGGGSSAIKAKNEISPLAGIQAQFPHARILHSMGYASGPSIWGRNEASPYDADSLRKEALALAAEADIVLFIGGLNKNYQQDCEGGDRLDFNLPFGQDELIAEISAINPNLGLLLISGNAVAMPWLEQVKGLMQVWYLGSQSGPAIGAVLSGQANPSGKLPFSFPKKLTDNAAHYFGPESYPGNSINQRYLEDILVGYRWHDTKQIAPQFPFGFGLSYSEFRVTIKDKLLASLRAGEALVFNCYLENTSKLEGATVVQVYIGKKESFIPRAEKELKAFEKVVLKGGEVRKIQIEMSLDDWAYYDEELKQWRLEPGIYQVYVGLSSELEPSFEIEVIETDE